MSNLPPSKVSNIVLCECSSFSNIIFKFQIFVTAPNQFHIIGVGIAGGLFGSFWMKPLKSLLWSKSNDKISEINNYGLSLLTAIVTGLLLPRFALAMDTSGTWIWDVFASLSTNV